MWKLIKLIVIKSQSQSKLEPGSPVSFSEYLLCYVSPPRTNPHKRKEGTELWNMRYEHLKRSWFERKWKIVETEKWTFKKELTSTADTWPLMTQCKARV